MIDFDKFAASVGRIKVLCVGDLMLDDFVYGDVSRISPEAPAPVIAVSRSEIVVGGAGNVARNISSLGAQCLFVGMIGDDEAAQIMTGKLAQDERITPLLVVDASRPTTRKVRFVSEHFSTHLLRADWEVAAPAQAATEDALIAQIKGAIDQVDIVVLSDYAKGVLTQRVIREAIETAKAADKPVIVDPKSANLAIYRGATLLTPNRKELSEATRSRAISDDDIRAAAREALAMVEGEAVLVTRSEAGMSLVDARGDAQHVPAFPVKVRDVSGAGDTVAAVMAVAKAAGLNWGDAMRLANAAASVVVGKRGTASLTLDELRVRCLPHASLVAEEKIIATAEQLAARIDAWRKQGLRIGFTNGCFDLLHPGHIKVLTQARAACDRLVLGLNSDASVKRLKGESRPIQTQSARAQVLAALEAVDLVAIFDEDTPLELIKAVRPHVLIKGGDYTRDQVVGADIVEADGGDVVLIDLVPGMSTTSMVARAGTKPLGGG